MKYALKVVHSDVVSYNLDLWTRDGELWWRLASPKTSGNAPIDSSLRHRLRVDIELGMVILLQANYAATGSNRTRGTPAFGDMKKIPSYCQM